MKSRTRPAYKKTSRSIVLRCDGSTAPGMSWAAIVRFVPKGQFVEAWHSSDSTEVPLERVGRWRGPLEPRALVRWVARREDVSNRGDFVSESRVSGLSGLWAEMLILAWNHGDDGTHELALDLLALDDHQLIDLRRWLGPLTSDDAREELSALFELEELRNAEADLARTDDDAHRSAEPGGPPRQALG